MSFETKVDAVSFEIRRNSHGIPQVLADTVSGLFAGQGYATAQDRLWQLEHDRRRALGRLAELTGQRGHLVADAFARRARLADQSRAGYDALDAETQGVLDAHAAGVNAWLVELFDARAADLSRSVPPELVHFAAPRPEPWEGWHSVAVFVIRHVTFATWQTKLWYARVLAALGPDAVPRFRSEGRGGETPLIVPPGVRAATGAMAEAGLFEAPLPALAGLEPLGLAMSGSNAWAVHGSRTSNGLPLVAGDPHRPFEAPNVYYQVRLTGAGVDAAGFSFPGVPGIPHFGQGAATAWAVTNAMADYQDLYVERLPEAIVDVRTESVSLRGEPDHSVECALTRHGPVVVGSAALGVGVALATAGLTEAGRSLRCLLPQLRAGSVAELDRAMSNWTEPANNVVMADAGGHIGYRTAGRIPLRSEINRWLPVPGWSDDHDWTGFVPDSELPRALDPAVGAIVTANQRVTDASYPYTLGIDAYPGHRAERIWDRLGHVSDLAAGDLAAIHVDVESLPARRLAEAVGGRLSGWDGEMRSDSEQAALYAVARGELVREVVAGLPESLRTNPFATWEPPATAFPVELRVANAIDNWIAEGDRTLLPPGRADWASAFRAALDRAVRIVDGRTWGDLHRFTPLRLGFAERLELDGVAGGSGCVMATNQISGVSTNALVGSTARYVWDLCDRSRSGWVVPLGASGDERSPHAADQFALWREGRLLPVFD